jgi:hypothetical protein
MTLPIPHWINNKKVTPEHSQFLPVYCPASGDVSKQVACADQALVNQAVASAHKAFPAWANTPVVKRAKIMFKFKELLEKNRKELLKYSLLQEQKLLKEREERKKLEDQRLELSKYLEKEGKDLETQTQNARVPQEHPIVGLYTQLQSIRYNYQQQDAVVDYARTTVLQDLHKEVIEVLGQYKEMPDELKEIANATYRLTKELLGEHNTPKQKYFP